MTPLQAAALVLYAAAAAASIANRDRRNRPVAWYLGAVVLLELLRLGFGAVLPADGQCEGLLLIARHADSAAYLAVSMALPAMAMALFLRRRPWAMGAAHLLVWGALVLSYPTVRGDSLMAVYAAVDLGGIAVSIGCFLMWTRSRRFYAEWGSAPMLSGQALIAAAMAICLLPRLTGKTLLSGWSMVVAANAFMVACVAAFQLRSLLAKP